MGGSACAVCGAGNYSANTLSCEPCQIGEYCVGGRPVGVRCPLAHSTTNGRGARSEDDCVCQVGYYMHEDVCTPCPTGTKCTAVGVTVANLPLLPNWWRLPNSTRLERCFAISNCTGGGDAQQLCGAGYEGAFCGVCSTNSHGTSYHRSVGRCEPCEGSIMPAIVGMSVALAVVLALLAVLRTSKRRNLLIIRVSKRVNKHMDDKYEKGTAQVRENTEEYQPSIVSKMKFGLPDISLPSIRCTLTLKFPDAEWPELPGLQLYSLQP